MSHPGGGSYRQYGNPTRKVRSPTVFGSALGGSRADGCGVPIRFNYAYDANFVGITNADELIRRQRILLVFGVAAMVGAGVWINRDRLLASAADRWVVSDPIGPADVAAIFGGGIEGRSFAAAQYYRQGLVREILISNPYHSHTEIRSDVAVTRRVVVGLGVPANAIEIFGNDLRNTHEEVLALKSWMLRHDLHSVIVPTEIYSTRRVRWMLHRGFGRGFTIRVVALNRSEYRRDNWRCSSVETSAFAREIIKYLYYRVAY